jgi:hypothetical protein
MDIFKDTIPSLLSNNNYKLESELEEKEYKAFLINKALSAQMDVIFYVDEMNRNHQLDNKLQYDFYFYSIKKYKRPFQKWLKTTEIEDIEIIKEYYGYSNQKAKEVIKLLSKEDLQYIRDKVEKGGQI